MMSGFREHDGESVYDVIFRGGSRLIVENQLLWAHAPVIEYWN